jgi:hypothetical protein
MRNGLFVLMAVVLATFALPSVAGGNDKKIYTLDMTQVTSAPPFTVTAKLTNKSPGNSSFKSFTLSVSGLTITSATTTNGVVQPAVPLSGTSAITVNNMFPVKPNQSVTVTMTVNSCGDGAWSATVWTGTPALNGQTFDLVGGTTATPISCGQIACGDGQGEGGAVIVPDSLNPDTIEVERGSWDKNGNTAGACSGIPYFVTNNLSANDQLHFRWLISGTGSDSAAAFQFTVFGDGPSPAQTNVAWWNTNGTPASGPGTPDFIPGQLCNSYANFLPTPYGTLLSDDGSTTLHVDTTTGGVASVPTTSFDVFIQDERLTVSVVDDTNPANEIWTISARNVGGVSGTVPHVLANLLVMSEPLPILTSTVLSTPPLQQSGKYVAGDQAQMCISDQFYDSESDTHTTTFIDIGDGWGGHP